MSEHKNAKKSDAGRGAAAMTAESGDTEAVETEAKNTEPDQTAEPSEKAADVEADGAVSVTDKRRVTLDGDLATSEVTEEAAVSAEEARPSIEELMTRLKEAETRRDEAERQARDFSERFRHAQTQLRAENDEIRVRMQRNFQQKLEAARGDVVASLLDVLDNLKLAIAAATARQGKGPEFDSLLGGVRATAQIFEAKLGSLGLTPVISVGEVFNPEIHEAVEVVTCAPDQDGRVVEELQAGYRFGERLLRPARVRVGRAGE
ncbi:MAG TPA: nucleotide exchange factor GrpE [Blastocatellia bacterium]|nr:nucleotide exchange factor GrpE [Blastocatellia bacterium]